MPRLDYVHCANCNGHRDDVGPLSSTRLCAECSRAILTDNIEGIATKTGAAYKRWRGGVIKWAAALEAERLQTRS